MTPQDILFSLAKLKLLGPLDPGLGVGKCVSGGCHMQSGLGKKWCPVGSPPERRMWSSHPMPTGWQAVCDG